MESVRPNFEFGATVSEDNNLIVWPTTGKFTALVDGDMLPYIVGYTINEMQLVKATTRVKDGQCATIKDTPECKNACDRINSLLNSWVFNCQADSAKIFLTNSEKNFRLSLAFTKPYKGTRNVEKPPFFYEMRDHLMEVHGAVLSDGNEADDLMSIEQWKSHELFSKECGGEFEFGSPEHKAFSTTIIASADKDLRIVIGWNYNPNDGGKTWVDKLGHLELKYRPNGHVKGITGSGLKFFYSQLITGDTVDNYAGIQGRGAKFAFDLLDTCKTEKELYMKVLGAYKDKYGYGSVKLKNHRGTYRIGTAYDLMLECGRLAHMSTFENDIWRMDKSPIVWGDDDRVWLPN